MGVKVHLRRNGIRRPADKLPSKSQIFEYWKDRFQPLGFFIDWGEPSCWACGFHYDVKYDIKRSDASWAQILRGWDKIPLQRCHIVPRSLGGSDEPGNLFLMCRECHDAAPNTIIADVFIEWAKAQNFYAREEIKILSASSAFGFEEPGFQVLAATIDSKEFRAWVVDKFGLHWPQSNYAPRSSRLTPATFVGLAAAYSRKFPGKSGSSAL
jgi:5-methylcytosine-specific restriction endonuclease McrA